MQPGMVIDQWYTMHQIVKGTFPKIHFGRILIIFTCIIGIYFCFYDDDFYESKKYFN